MKAMLKGWLWILVYFVASSSAYAVTPKYFLGSLDLPAERIPMTAEIYQKEFAPFLLQGHASAGVDFKSLLVFNERAANLWKALVECSEGNTEKARDSVQYAKFPCFTGRGTAPLHQELKNLHSDFGRFLETSLVLDAEFVGQPQEHFRVPAMHPLLSQVLIDLLAQEKIIYAVDKRVLGVTADVKFSDAKRIRNFVLFYVLYFPTHRCSDLGLWPGITSFFIGEMGQSTSAGFFAEYEFSEGNSAKFLDRIGSGRRSVDWFGATISLACDKTIEVPLGNFQRVMFDGNNKIMGMPWDVALRFREIGRFYTQ